MPKLYFNEEVCAGTLIPNNEKIGKDLDTISKMPLVVSTYCDVSQSECEEVKNNIKEGVTLTTKITNWLNQAIANFQSFETRTSDKVGTLSKFEIKLLGDLSSLNGKKIEPNKFMDEIEKALAVKDFSGIAVDIADIKSQLQSINQSGKSISETTGKNGTLFKQVQINGINYDVWVPSSNIKGSTLYFHGMGDMNTGSYKDYLNTDQVLIIPQGVTGTSNQNQIDNSFSGFTEITNEVFGSDTTINVAGHSMGVKAAINVINSSGANFNQATLISGQSYGALYQNIPSSTDINLVYSTNDTGSAGAATEMNQMYEYFKENGYNVSGGEFTDNPSHVAMFHQGISSLDNHNIASFETSAKI